MKKSARLGALAALLLGGSGCAPWASARPLPSAAPEPALAAAVAEVPRSLPRATRDRVVRLQLRGMSGVEYRLQTACESGRSSMEVGSADGRHVLRLPPGPCLVTVLAGAAVRRQRFEHVFTVTEAPEQDVVFDVTVWSQAAASVRATVRSAPAADSRSGS